MCGGGCTKKAEGVCELILPGARMCGPFEEGILHSWTDGVVVHPLVWG